ncbi:Type I restriction-modification system, DNA-methyltransferase subunit M (EC [Olavius algarvensis Delta 1 endosymbiont]|nr:Type I restriction-modification system, DNA-methyltransferase subunit M (EC [Olavius algarvensis Delta 1 endosymbiont]
MNPQELKQLEDDLWRSADTLRANSDLKATEYSTPVLGLIFLKFAGNKYRRNEEARKKGKRNTTDRPIKELKTALETLHADVNNAESYCKHIQWLQERFPRAEYEDVTGLCKSATPQEVKEQDYSLNPGRYVGVVIEEDGKTEEEFVEELLAMNQELSSLNREARKLEKIIHHNALKLTEGK